MSSIQKTIQWYDGRAPELAGRYEGFDPAELHAWFADLLPSTPGVVIDIGAGSGRDAAWFASKGHKVIAVEPSAKMRAEGQRLRENAKFQWLDDRLPSLSATLAKAIAADVVHLGAVWMHVPPEDRPRAFRKIVSLTKSGGYVVMSVKRAAPNDECGLYPASVYEIECLARGHGLVVVRVEHSEDKQGRKGVSWDHVALRLLDDGTDALPLLRHIILNGKKSSTYKLGLLRSICRAAEGAAGMAREAGDDHVAVPLGLLAMYWLRLYLPLVAADLPQSGTHTKRGGGLTFVNPAFEAIMDGLVPSINLRIGAVFSMADAKIVHSAIARAVYNILKNPADYTRYADGRPIFPVEECDGTPTLKDGVLDAGYLASFGSLLVPVNVWRAMQRFGTWIEPSIVAEWIKLMKGYAATRRDELSETAIAKAMTWEEIDRDVDVARGRALELMANQPIYCVWTGAKLDAKTLAMDHAFPWSAWPCGDLWNLFPSRNHANQNKSDKLPSDRLLVDRRDAIQSWWRDGYEKRDDLAPKFLSEARTSLPGLVADDGALGMDDVFAGMRFQRLRLWRDQQIPEWDGR